MPRPKKPRPQSAPPLRLVSHSYRSGRVSRQEVHYSTSKDDTLDVARKARPASGRPPRPRRAAPRPLTPGAEAPSRWPSGMFQGRGENEDPVDDDAPASASKSEKPQLSEGKMRDYGYGVPQWSPYYRPRGYKPEAVVRPSSRDYGHFPASQSLSPALQMRSARANIKEMKGRATVDHLWETMGSRPKCVNDLHWIEVAREQAALEEAHHLKMSGAIKL